MSGPILAVRIARRAIGVATVSAGAITFLYGRHVTSRRERAVDGAAAYLSRVVEMARPRIIAVDAQPREGSTAHLVLSRLVEIAGTTPVCLVPLASLLRAFGLPALRSRRELREAGRTICPPPHSRSITPLLLDVSAVALFAETAVALGDLHD